MNASEQDQCVTMIHQDLTAVPEYGIPPNYHIRWYQPGDQAIWTALQLASDLHNTIDKTLFSKQFPKTIADLADRQCYLCDQSQKEIGTVTAWEKTRGPFSGYGQIHWMAVLPEFQNQGLGTMLMSTACQQLRLLGYKRGYLETSTLRLNAIALYTKFGFSIIRTEPWD